MLYYSRGPQASREFSINYYNNIILYCKGRRILIL
nr:MAG TPA: hypothetical protein [Caudoviricetes sp.]